ncbi:hypothetical protein OG230_13095 [Streptomyces sp. NBC_00234]|uniref:hypothetical protein n=1 Tax=Streptomyces sp. NBC_00234 TaxID=2903638 RepID=UPI002E2DCB99|nr:hypothetical protein [Streptomyces sp. NBC_00234]
MSSGGYGPYGPSWQPNRGGSPYRNPHPYPPATVWQRFRSGDWPTLRELLRPARRIHGCVWAVLLLCFWSFLLPPLVLYPMARSARAKARQVFPEIARHRIQDPDVARLQKARAWAALAATFLLLVAYGNPEEWEQAQDQFTLRLAVTPWLLLLSAPVVVAILMRCAPPHARQPMRARLRPAVRTALRYFGSLTAVPVLFAAGFFVRQAVDGVAWAPFLSLALLLPALWVTLFVAFASSTVVRSAFSTAEVHAALPALLTGVLVWEFAAISLAVGGMPPGPPLVQVLAVLGGPASVTALVWWEIDRLRTRYGITLRG